MRIFRIILLILPFIILNSNQTCQASVTANIIQRVLFIRNGSSTGSGFTIEVDDRQYLITARHILPASGVVSTLDIYYKGVWQTVSVKSIPVLPNNVDIGVLVVPQLLTPTYQVHLDKSIFLSEDVYFLGYPYGIIIDGAALNNGIPLPFVKHAIISAFDVVGIGTPIFLDGINNPGFSGGPVVHMGTDNIPEIIGVISGYQAEQQSVVQSGKATGLSVSTNTGLVIMYQLGSALEAIKRTPIGFPIH